MILKNTRFSIVIPLYNKEETISTTIESILNQVYDDYEILVVDDGSTDNSLSVMRLFSDARLKILMKENGGVSSARNFALEHACGKYIAFLDADDFWHPAYLKEMNQLIEDYPECALFASAFKKVTKQKTVVYGSKIKKGIVKDFFQMKIESDVPVCSAAVVRKDVFDEVGGFPIGMISGEDDYMWAKIAGKYKIALTPKCLSTYNFINSGISLRKGKVDTCTESWFDFYQEDDFYRNEFIAHKAIHAAIRYVYSGAKKKSLEIENWSAYTKLSKKKWRYLYLLNRLPYWMLVFYKNVKSLYKAMKNDRKNEQKQGAPYLKIPSYQLDELHNSA